MSLSRRAGISTSLCEWKAGGRWVRWGVEDWKQECVTPLGVPEQAGRRVTVTLWGRWVHAAASLPSITPRYLNGPAVSGHPCGHSGAQNPANNLLQTCYGNCLSTNGTHLSGAGVGGHPAHHAVESATLQTPHLQPVTTPFNYMHPPGWGGCQWASSSSCGGSCNLANTPSPTCDYPFQLHAPTWVGRVSVDIQFIMRWKLTTTQGVRWRLTLSRVWAIHMPCVWKCG